MPILPQYLHIVNRKLKHTYLSFDDEANLIIKSPKVSQGYIEKLLLKKAAWITRSKAKILEKKGSSPTFSKEDVLYYLGEPYPLQQHVWEKKSTKLLKQEEDFLLCYHHYDEKLFRKHVDAFYRSEAEQYIPPLVENWSRVMQLSYQKISFRKTKRQWGSCSNRNALSFNTMIMKLPKEIIEYIVVHELAHILHKHHQKDFWDCVASYLPDYKARIAVLKTFTT